jgi:hypothetical protein
MAVRIPLNKFQRVSYQLTTTPTKYYTVPFDRASIVLIGLGTNLTPDMHTVTIAISSGDLALGQTYTEIIKDIEIGAKDAAHLLVGKVVLTDGDSIIAHCSGLSAINLTLSLLEAVNT